MKKLNKNELTPKEKELLEYIPFEGIWQKDIIGDFVYSIRYIYVFTSRLTSLEKKGYIRISYEWDPVSHRQSKKLYRIK
jgi:hypothetical protein